MNHQLQMDVNDNRDSNTNYKRQLTNADMSRQDAIKQLR